MISKDILLITFLHEPELIFFTQVLPLWARVDLETMAMKRYSAFPKDSALLKPDHLIVLCHYQDTRWRSLNL